MTPAPQVRSEASHKDLFHRLMTRHELRQRAEAVDLHSALVKLSMLRLLFEMPGAVTDATKALVLQLRPGKLRDALVVALGRGEVHAIASPQTLTAAQALLLMFARRSAAGSKPRPNTSYDDLVWLLLACSDEITKSCVLTKPGVTRNEVAGFVHALALRNVSDAHREVLVRCWLLYFEIWDEYAVDSCKPSFRSLFRKSCGNDPRLHVAFGFLLAEALVQDSDDLGGRASASITYARFEGAGFSLGDYQRLLEYYGLDLRTADARSLAEWWTSGDWAVSDTWLVQTPIVRLADGDVIASGTFLMMGAIEGVFWSAIGQLPRRERESWLNDRGEVFERYVRRVAQTGWRTASIMHGQIAFGPRTLETDCLVVEGQTALVAECTAGAPPSSIRDLRRPGLVEFIDKKIVPKIEQAAERLMAIDERHKAVAGDRSVVVDRSRGLVVLLYHAPAFGPLVVRVIAERVSELSVASLPYLHRIDIVSIGEFEEMAASGSLVRVYEALEDKARNDAESSMHDYLVARWGPELADGSRARLAGEYQRIGAEALSAIRGAE